MGRVKVRAYVDVVRTHPEYTDEEREQLLKEETEKSAKLTEWQKM